MGFPEINGGTPNNGWFIRENPNLKWMMTGGTPLFQETSICTFMVQLGSSGTIVIL